MYWSRQLVCTPQNPSSHSLWFYRLYRIQMSHQFQHLVLIAVCHSSLHTFLSRSLHIHLAVLHTLLHSHLLFTRFYRIYVLCVYNKYSSQISLPFIYTYFTCSYFSFIYPPQALSLNLLTQLYAFFLVRSAFLHQILKHPFFVSVLSVLFRTYTIC